MKKIFYSMVLGIVLLLTSCNKPNVANEGIKVATEYISSLESYEAKCNMTIYRNNKNMNMEVTVNYLKPNYYRVKFVNSNGHEQWIVKNDEGVFVLTPSINKEFKFDSEWPLNSTHAYLLEGLCKDITLDTTASFTTDGDTIIIEAKLQNKANTATKVKFYYDSKEKKPLKAYLLDDADKEVVYVEFKSFEANKAIEKAQFNTKLIMEDSTNSTENTSAEVENENQTVSVGAVAEGVVLSSSKINDEVTILCYQGDVNYTIVVQSNKVYASSLAMERYTEMEFIESGILVKNENCSKYFLNGLEVVIYANDLDISQVIAIAEEISVS